MIGKTVEFFISYAVFIVPVLLLVLLVFSSAARTAACFVLRVVARPLLLLAVVALVYDGTRTLAGGSGLVITPFIEHWQNFAPRSVALLQGFIGRAVHPGAWDGLVLRLAALPSWLVIGMLGMLLAWLGRRRRGAKVFIN